MRTVRFFRPLGYRVSLVDGDSALSPRPCRISRLIATKGSDKKATNRAARRGKSAYFCDCRFRDSVLEVPAFRASQRRYADTPARRYFFEVWTCLVIRHSPIEACDPGHCFVWHRLRPCLIPTTRRNTHSNPILAQLNTRSRPPKRATAPRLHPQVHDLREWVSGGTIAQNPEKVSRGLITM